MLAQLESGMFGLLLLSSAIGSSLATERCALVDSENVSATFSNNLPVPDTSDTFCPVHCWFYSQPTQGRKR